MSFQSYLRTAALGLAFGAACGGWAAGDSPVSVTLAEEMKQYNLQGEFIVPVDPQTVWDVLTDYDHLSKFIHSMRGHIRSGNGDDLVVSQVGTGGFLFFTVSVKVLLRIHEEPIHSIEFTDISGKDFKSYSGSWTLQPVPEGMQVIYRLHAERNQNTPGFISGGLLQSTTRDLLDEVRKEMERRQALQTTKNPPMGVGKAGPK